MTDDDNDDGDNENVTPARQTLDPMKASTHLQGQSPHAYYAEKLLQWWLQSVPDAIKLPEPLPLEGNDPPPPVEPPLPASSPAEPSAKVRLDFSGLIQHALLRPHWRL